MKRMKTGRNAMTTLKAFLKGAAGTALVLTWVLGLGAVVFVPTFVGLATAGAGGGVIGLIVGLSLAAGTFQATMEWLAEADR